MKERKQWWIFTFGCGQQNAGHYVKIFGTFAEARVKMIERYGLEWAFQYSTSEWNDWVNKAKAAGCSYMLETELEE